MGATEQEPATNVLDPLVIRARGRVGQVLKEKWRLDVLLGVGGMAAVYAATHRNGSRVAVKILHSELTVNPEVCKRFLREGYAANSVGHDGVVRVSDDDIAEDGSAFLVMDLLDGETLEDRRTRFAGRLGEDDVLSIADQLLDVLVAAHAKGVVHRDLKPENLFLTRSGQLRVLDFGIARIRELSNTRATKTGAAMGTPSFMAPEQARALWDQVDARSDLWAVGATMFALLSGREVHQGRTANEVLIAAATQPAPPLASLLPSVSPSVARVVDKALAFEREHRWLDASRMQEAVRAAYHDRHGASIATAAKLTVPPTVKNRTLPVTALEPVVPRAPTTGQPVATSRPGVSRPGASQPAAWIVSRLSSRPAVLGLSIGGAVLAGLIGVAVALLSSGSKTAAPPASLASAPSATALGAQAVSGTSSTLQAPPPIASPASEPSAPPAVAATDLPEAPATVAATPKPTPKAPPLATANAAAVTAAAPKVKASCTPPYTLDSR